MVAAKCDVVVTLPLTGLSSLQRLSPRLMLMLPKPRAFCLPASAPRLSSASLATAPAFHTSTVCTKNYKSLMPLFLPLSTFSLHPNLPLLPHLHHTHLPMCMPSFWTLFSLEATHTDILGGHMLPLLLMHSVWCQWTGSFVSCGQFSSGWSWTRFGHYLHITIIPLQVHPPHLRARTRYPHRLRHQSHYTAVHRAPPTTTDTSCRLHRTPTFLPPAPYSPAACRTTFSGPPAPPPTTPPAHTHTGSLR